MTRLYHNVPETGQIGRLSEPDSSVTLDCDFSDYDMLFVLFSTRLWGWGQKWEFIPVIFLDDTASSVNNVFSVVMPSYFDINQTMSMQYYITNNNTITVQDNSNYTSENHLYIKSIYGVKFITNRKE